MLKLELKLNYQQTLTPMIAFNSDIVTCFALSTALATCCWCSWARNGISCAMMVLSRFAISV